MCQWDEAIQEELRSLVENCTWDYVPSNVNVKPIGFKWVFRTKISHDGSRRYKARAVIKGYEQTDYGETYAPIAKLIRFRILSALTALHWWGLDHMDVTAFLNPPVE